MSLKKDCKYEKSTLKSLFSCGKYIFLSEYSYNIPQIILFNISMLVHVFSQTPHITHSPCPEFCKVHPPPHFMCSCHSKTPFKCIEDPITNQITQSFDLRGL